MGRLVVLLALAGCNEVFGLAATEPRECWNPEPTEHDEDADNLDDHCDNCPADVNPKQEDDDRDGVGDACDPHPGMADRIDMFEPFETVDRWQPLDPFMFGAIWVAGVDQYEQTTAVIVGQSELTTGSLTYPSVEMVLSGITGTDTTIHGAGAVIRFVNPLDTAKEEIVLCGIGVASQQPTLLLQYLGVEQSMIGYPASPDAGHVALITTPNEPVRCVGYVDPGQKIETSLSIGVASQPGHIRAGTLQSPAQFRSLTVFRLGGT